MKRISLTLTATLLAAILLTGCNTGSTDSSSQSSESSSSSQSLPTFSVKFHDYDGNVIYETQVQQGGTAVFNGELPKVAATLEKCYPFKAWDTSLENVTCDLNVNPTHGEEYNIADFEFVDDCKVFQNATVFNEDTTSFLGYLKQFGFITYLKEDVLVDDTWKDYDMVAYEDETVAFDYSNVNVAEKGNYTFKVTVRGLTKEFPIEVVTDTSKWVFDKEIAAGYKTFDPSFSGELDSIKFYQDNNCLLESITYSEFEAFTYEMADENTSVIIRSEDGSIDCKYAYGSDIRNYEIDAGHQYYIEGTRFDWIKLDTAVDFTTTTSGYAYITATFYSVSSIFATTPKYEYNPDTKIMKIYNPELFTTLQYNSDTGKLVVVE